MSNFLYNGVELPGLPETWNEAAHPHLFIRVVSLDGSAENAVYSLFAASAAAVSYDDNGILFPSSAVGEKYAVSDGAWVESSESLSDAFYIKRNDGFLYTLWANFDILNSDGSVYIAASEPVLVVEKFPVREWIGWLLAGLCSRPLPMGAREPMAYLLNGRRVPVFPAWDKVKYPFAYFCVGGFHQALMFSDIELVYDGNYHFGPPEGKTAQIIRYQDSYGFENGWGEPTSTTMESKYSEYPEWCSRDCYLVTGELYLAASEPVPVYE